MTVGATDGPNSITPGTTNDPRYKEAMACMQDGSWPQAIEYFSDLVRDYPNNRRFQNALEMAQFKADVDASTNVRAKRWILPGPRALLPLLVLVVITILLFYAVRFTINVLGPLLAEAEQTTKMDTALDQARNLLDQELFDEARTKLQDEVLALSAQNKPQKTIHIQASGLLATIDLDEQVFERYQEGVALMEKEEYGSAVVLFRDILTKRPDYKDVAKRLTEIEQLAKLLELFLQADLFYKEGTDQRVQTIATYEALRELDDKYQQEAVEGRLMELYLAGAQSILSLEPPAPERLPEVLSYLNRLVQIAPRQEPGRSMFRMANDYQAGADAYATADWETAVNNLGAVVKQEPDYLGGRAVELLYPALISWADELQEKGETEKANEMYARAEELPVSDTDRARSGSAQTAPASTQASAVVTIDINVRSGPGTSYSIIGGANQGTQFAITGKNPSGDWWQIDYNGQAGWLFGQLVTTENTGDVPIAENIPQQPRVVQQPTNTPVPAPPTAIPAPVSNFKFNSASLVRCDPNAGITYVQGRTLVGGQPQNGDWSVAFSYAANGPVVAQIKAGPHPGYEGWAQGFFSHILQTDGPREGNWFFWVVDPSGKRISEYANVQTNGSGGSCQNAVIEFDSR